jgi:hypothetical protein
MCRRSLVRVVVSSSGCLAGYLAHCKIIRPCQRGVSPQRAAAIRAPTIRPLAIFGARQKHWGTQTETMPGISYRFCLRPDVGVDLRAACPAWPGRQLGRRTRTLPQSGRPARRSRLSSWARRAHCGQDWFHKARRNGWHLSMAWAFAREAPPMPWFQAGGSARLPAARRPQVIRPSQHAGSHDARRRLPRASGGPTGEPCRSGFASWQEQPAQVLAVTLQLQPPP